ncbi:multicopper oxidase family protein [Paenibacillus sp. NPDC058071]|uniref:multicopper oxidase family protein n=1 Tax=Paenibacillus sp. NPDC058071 TaxID=3346326 RepID=UPI0036DADCF2
MTGYMLAMASLVLSIIICSIAGIKASAIMFSRTEAKMHRKAKKIFYWAIYATVPAAGILVSTVLFLLSGHSVFWLDRLALIPLAGVPAAMIWLLAAPRLKRLRIATGRKPETPPGVRLVSRAAHPALIAPFQFGALGSIAGLYILLTSTAPFRPLSIAVPFLLLLVAGVAIWTAHLNRSSRVSLAGEGLPNRPWMRLLGRLAAAVLIGLAVAYPFYNAKEASQLPASLSMSAGAADYGTGLPLVHEHHHAKAVQTAAAAGAGTGTGRIVSVDQLKGPADRQPDVSYTLTASVQTIKLRSGESVDAWTYNGQIPGPELRARVGQLIEVKLVNQDIEGGVTLHWHGLDVPNGEDGVAGATQDAVMPGESYTYRFVVEQAGSFWYHSHQMSKEAVDKGLFGSLVVEPSEGLPPGTKDITVLTHLWRGAGFAIGDDTGIQRVSIAPGTPVRLRLTNTDDWVRQSYSLTGTAFQVAAIDGTDLNNPGDLIDVSLALTTGGRYDVTFVMPDKPVFLGVGFGSRLGILMSADGTGDIPVQRESGPVFDPTRYGQPTETAFGADSVFDRQFRMVLDNKLGFYNGSFGLQYTINGELFPNTPMFMVKKGELIKTTIINRGAVDHPMHLHGHHMLVLSRNGERVSGSPWWSDTLDVGPGEIYEVAFIANNPGLWMDHCHNLTHAAAGMSMHLMYEGVESPYEVGRATPNHPE